jgi:hypothetical protein
MIQRILGVFCFSEATENEEEKSNNPAMRREKELRTNEVPENEQNR